LYSADLKIGSLCSGYGGLDRAVSAVFGGRAAWHAETDDAAKLVLEKRYDGVPNLGDIERADWRAAEPVGLVCGGIPCQPFSAAGKRKGRADRRYLWPAGRACVATLRPGMVVLENVAGLVSMRSEDGRKGGIFADILADLRALGYAVAWGLFGACLSAVQGCHHRHRVFVVARRWPGPYGPPEAVRWPGAACGVPTRGRALLPSPQARDGDWQNRGEGDARYWAKRAAAGRTNGMPLGAALSLELLPTPQSRDGDNRVTDAATAGQRLADGRRNLDDAISSLELLPTPSAVPYGSNRGGAAGRVGPVRHSLDELARLELLPTPTVIDARAGRNATSGRSAGAASTHHAGTTLSDVAYSLADELLPTPRATDHQNGATYHNSRGEPGGMASAVQPEHFGRYAAAVARWSAVHGLPPAPTEHGPRGGRRLAAAFPEWMMGLAAGFVTDVVDRTAALRMVGNGVFPLQAYVALSTLRDML
jgi:DNA (cytosine-5)-methyltransferase 1